jgi:divalent metal cation (Fe/Co/Zn/Cd) transporter
MAALGCLGVVALVGLTYAAFQYPWLWGVAALVLASWIAYSVSQNRQKKIDSIGSFEAQAAALNDLAAEFS